MGWPVGVSVGTVLIKLVQEDPAQCGGHCFLWKKSCTGLSEETELSLTLNVQAVLSLCC